MDEVQCTARNENSVIIKLYRCVNGTGIPLKTCTNSQSTLTRRVSTNCAVTISGAENASETFYCTERGLIDRMDRLSAHYSVIVLSGKPL